MYRGREEVCTKKKRTRAEGDTEMEQVSGKESKTTVPTAEKLTEKVVSESFSCRKGSQVQVNLGRIKSNGSNSSSHH